MLNDRSMERYAHPAGRGEEKVECMEVRPGEMVLDG